MKIYPKGIIIVLLSLYNSFVFSQTNDASSFILNSRLTFYSYEDEGEMLLLVPPSYRSSELKIILSLDGKVVNEVFFKSAERLNRIPFKITVPPGKYKATAVIRRENSSHSATASFVRLEYKSNEVKADNLTGGLIVNKRQFFPFGFYCYSPLHPTMPEEEVIRGFNMMSPYQKINYETLNDRKAYMDRCAELGMKVNYNLLSVSGGGGVGSKIEGISNEEKRKRLIEEINTFRDHPALLGWYISDEPNGYKIKPEILEEIYRTVKEADPWHPVSIVFMAPFISSKKYANALDIVMADPYPVPDIPVSLIGNVTGQLKAEFAGKKPVWIAQQSFGGGEIWGREPTLQEVRSMTWQAIIRGATGIQYFVRQGLNYFPKSAATWNECGRIAMEVAELTPWLLSDEETLPVESSSPNILLSSKRHNDQLLVMVVNKVNEPAIITIKIPGIKNARAKLILENRSLPVTGGSITDHLAAFGSQVYLISLNPDKNQVTSSGRNLLRDPGFEDISSPGIPASCYARPGGDRGATYFLDTREKVEGNHSVRLITPQENKSVALRFYPFSVKAGNSYIISIWAKSDPEQRLKTVNEEFAFQAIKEQKPQYVEVITGDFGHARFVPDNEWRQYVTFVTIPEELTPASFKINLILKMPGQGVAWFDEMRVIEEESLE